MTNHPAKSPQWQMFRRSDEQLGTVPTPESFCLVIERLVARYGISYFDAILELCDHYDREYESVTPLLTSRITEALAEEAAAKNLLKDNSFLHNRLL